MVGSRRIICVAGKTSLGMGWPTSGYVRSFAFSNLLKAPSSSIKTLFFINDPLLASHHRRAYVHTLLTLRTVAAVFSPICESHACYVAISRTATGRSTVFWVAKVRISLGAMLGPEGGIQSYPDLKIAIRVERKAAETER